MPGPLADRIAVSLDLADRSGIDPQVAQRAQAVRDVFSAMIPYRGPVGG